MRSTRVPCEVGATARSRGERCIWAAVIADVRNLAAVAQNIKRLDEQSQPNDQQRYAVSPLFKENSAASKKAAYDPNQI